MYSIIHPSYKKAWKKEKLSFSDIQALTGLDKNNAEKLVKSLLGLGAVIETKKSKKINLDINNDGKFDKKDLTKSAKILNAGKKLKNDKN